MRAVQVANFLTWTPGADTAPHIREITVMKKLILTALASAATGFVGGAGAMLIAFPFLFPPPALDEPPPSAVSVGQTQSEPRLLEASVNAQQAARQFAGSFDQTSPGRDALHWANGGVGIYRQGDRFVLRLESDFVAGPGPDFVLYLNTRKIGDEKDFKADAGRIKLTKLRAFKGGQNYLLPAGIDLSGIRSVTIWCESFSEFIGNAVVGA